MSKLSTITKFIETIAWLENYSDAEQKVKINELNDEMNKEEFQSVITEDFYYDLNSMIADGKLLLENVFSLLKHIGYSKVLAGIKNEDFDDSFLKQRFELIIVNDGLKTSQVENQFTNLCACFAILLERFTCSRKASMNNLEFHLLYTALDIEKENYFLKDSEMILFAASILKYEKVEIDQFYAQKIQTLILDHQNSRILSQLAYQSAWHIFYIKCYDVLRRNFYSYKEMHFVSESTGEIEKLSRCIDWKKKAVSIKEKAKIGIIERWYSTICLYTEKCKLSEEESAWLVACTTRLIGLAKDNHRSIVEKCIPIIVACMDENTDIFFSDFLRGRTVDFVLEEMCKFNSDDQSTDKRMIFLSLLTERLNKNVRIARDEKKNKALKMAILDKLEEEGYEDLQISFYGTGHDQN